GRTGAPDPDLRLVPALGCGGPGRLGLPPGDPDRVHQRAAGEPAAPADVRAGGCRHPGGGVARGECRGPAHRRGHVRRARAHRLVGLALHPATAPRGRVRADGPQLPRSVPAAGAGLAGERALGPGAGAAGPGRRSRGLRPALEARPAARPDAGHGPRARGALQCAAPGAGDLVVLARPPARSLL
ncbi:MAG: hypothetical protein AVDCRST_MAG51-1087, partial [uncultured Ramlibacter sp.]